MSISKGTGKIKILKLRDNGNGYLTINTCKGNIYKNYYVHRLVLEAFIPNLKNKEFGDHKDNDKHNNNVENLRWASCSENNCNRKMRSDNTSGIIGVSFDCKRNKYRAQIMINKENIELGFFEYLEEAKNARKQAEITYHNEFRFQPK